MGQSLVQSAAKSTGRIQTEFDASFVQARRKISEWAVELVTGALSNRYLCVIKAAGSPEDWLDIDRSQATDYLE